MSQPIRGPRIPPSPRPVIWSCWVSWLMEHERHTLTVVAAMGYKQELKRQYSTVQIFAVAFSIMGLVPSIASTIAFSLPAGPVGMIWVRWTGSFSSLQQTDSVRGGSLRVYSFFAWVWHW